MGLLDRIEQEAVKRLSPWLTRGHDAGVKIVPSSSQFLLQLRNVSLDVAVVNEMAFATSPIELQELVVDEADLKISLFSSPVLTLVVRGVHVVLKPRLASDHMRTSSTESLKAKKVGATFSDSDAKVSTSAKVTVKQGKGGAGMTQFFINSLANFALSSVRIELHEISIKFVSQTLRPWRYACSASLECFVLEEDYKTAGGLYRAALQAVHSRWDPKAGLVKKLCTFRGLTLNLETISSTAKNNADGSANATSVSNVISQEVSSLESRGGVGRQQCDTNNIHNDEDDTTSTIKRNQILSLEAVLVVVKLQEVEFLGLEVEVPEVLAGLDAKELDVLMVLLAQVNGAEVLETDKTLELTSVKAKRSPGMVRHGLSQNDFKTELHPESGSLTKLLENNVTKPAVRISPGSCSAREEPRIVHIRFQDLFCLLAWQVWVHSLSQVVGFVGHILFMILLSVQCVPALMIEAYRYAFNRQQPFSEGVSSPTGEDDSHDADQNEQTLASVTLEDNGSEKSLFKVVKNRGPTFEFFFSKGLCTLTCAMDDEDQEENMVSTSAGNDEGTKKLEVVGVLQPGVRLTLDRISLQYGLDNIGSGGRLGIGGWQLDLISVLHSGSPNEKVLNLQQGRWLIRTSDNLQILRSRPYLERSNKHDRFKDFQDIEDVPQAASALQKHYVWQKNAARSWNQHIWRRLDNSQLQHDDDFGASLEGSFSKAFLMVEFGSAGSPEDGTEALGGLMTCALSMGCIEIFGDSTISYRIKPLLEQLSTTKKSPENPTPAPVNPEISNEELIVKYINLCRHYIGLAVPISHVELSVVIESSKLIFAATMGQFEDNQQARVADSDGILHSSRGSSLIVEIGSLQLLTWPATKKEIISELEARVPMKDAAPIGWWDESVDQKLWLKRPPSPTFPEAAMGSEEAQVANNLYFALEDAGVMLRVDRTSKTIVPIVGPVSCVIQSSLCRDNLHSQWGEIKSCAVSFEGKLAPVTLHLYLEEVAIFSEISEFGNALMEGFTSLNIVSEEQLDENENTLVEADRKISSGQNLRDPNVTEDGKETPKILFALHLNVQLEALQFALADHRHSENDQKSNGQDTAQEQKHSAGRKFGQEKDGLRGSEAIHRYPGQGRTCYFATLPASLDVSMGDGYETQISIQMNGAHLGIVAKHLKGMKEQQILDQSLVDSTALDFVQLLQIAESGFAFDSSAIIIRGPKLVGEVETQEGRVDRETHVDVSLSSIGRTASSPEKELVTTAGGQSSDQFSPQVSGINQVPGNHMNPENAISGLDESDRPPWLVIMVDIGILSVTDTLGEALVDKVMLVASGGSTLHINVGLGKDLRDIAMDVEGGLAIIQTTALHSLVDYVNVHLQLLTAATSVSRPSSLGNRDVFGSQRANSADCSNPLVRSTARSLSLPPWGVGRKTTKVRRMLSAPRRLQAATEITHESTLKKGFDGNVSALLSGLSVVLVQRGSTSAAPVEGFLMEVDAKGKAAIKNGSLVRTSLTISRASILGLQGRTFGGVGNRNNTNRTPQFRHNFSGSGSGDIDQPGHRHQHSYSSGFSEDNADEEDANQETFLDDGSWRPVDDSHSYVLEQLSLTFVMEKVHSDQHPDFWKWRNSWKGTCSMVGFDFAITTSEVQLLLSVTSPLSGMSSSSSSIEPQLKEYTKNAATAEVEIESINAESYLPDGAIIALKDMNEHYYLAVEEMGTNSGTFRLVGVLHYSLIGDRALFKVKYQRTKNGKTMWFSLLSLHAKDNNGQPYRVHYLPGSGLAEVANVHDSSLELWQCIESVESKSEGNEDLGVQISRRAFHLVNQKSKCGLALADGSPMLVKQPGNAFKVRILAQQDDPEEDVKLVSIENAEKEEVDNVADDHDNDDYHLREKAIAATVIPNVTCDIRDFTFTLLHEASGGMHLLPLLRLCMQDMGAMLQIGSGKTRVLFGCSLSLDYFQAQNSCWVAIINPIGTELVYRTRNEQYVAGVVSKKTPTALFSRLRKVDIIISELSLDTLLFLIGALDLAGPYTLRHSPVLANRCQVENQTGLDLVCRFDHGKAKQDGVVQSWETNAFLIRHTTSRRDLTSAEVASSVDLYLEKQDAGRSSTVQISLTEPGLVAVRTRLHFRGGKRNSAPGPILVVDVLRQSQGGVALTVSPMVRIRNATGLFLELQCRRPNQEGDGAVVLLEDGDIIDDSMGSFDALRLEGELRKALTSFNVGNFLLSIRPVSSSTTNANGNRHEDISNDSSYEWSEDVKGAKAVRVSNLFEKFQYSFKRKLGGRNSDVSFGTVYCPAKRPEKEEDGLHFLVRTTKRQVPVTRPEKDMMHGKPPVASWQEQQELLLLPTIRILNLFSSSISAKLFALAPGRAMGKAGSLSQPRNEISITAGKQALMYADLGNLSLVIKHHRSGLTSKQVTIFARDKKAPDASIEGGSLREMELQVDFGDGAHYGLMNVHQDDDGVLEVVLYTKYALHNDSHVPFLYCAPKQRSSYLWRRGKSNDSNLEWPQEETVSTLQPGSKTSWFNKSSKVMMKQVVPDAQPSILDLDLLAGSTEISLKVASSNNSDQRVQLGVELQLPAVGDTNPTRTVHLAPRYIVVNKSREAICVCQDGFQDDPSAVMVLDSGEKTALHCRVSPDQSNEKSKQESGQEPFQAPLSVRFKPRGPEWDWSGPVCAAALGSFWMKIRRRGQMGKSVESNTQKQSKGRVLFALAEVQEDSPSLVMSFRRHSTDSIPYRIENALQSGALLYNQKGLSQTEVIEAGASVNYVWDDLGLPHKLVVTIQGTQLCHVINMDKIREWKQFGAARRNKVFSLQLPFLDESKDSENEDESPGVASKLLNVGYEVVADGPTRVVRICIASDSNRQSGWQSNMRKPQMEVEVKVPLLFFSIVEPRKQTADTSSDEKEFENQSTDRRVSYSPIIIARATNLLVEGIVTAECSLCQLKVERLDVDVKWQGATLAHMLRVHGKDAHKLGQVVLHVACVVAHRGTNPIQIHYASLLLQAVDLNIDEDTLMKLAPFYRTSLALSTGPSRLIYYERFEIHPIKILASFTPGSPRADYTSAQETLRALLHTVIKVPAVRGFKVELNGVLLSNALLTYRQLAVKCAQHYSWYAMRAIYIARGSSLLPPAFASLFDDSASSSLDVFFDPSNGSVDVQGLTLGMFNVLSKGLRKKGQGGTSRLLGDVEHTVKAAGSNLLFAVVTEVSDSVLKGAETSGFDGLLSGFRRGILNVAMRPAVLRSAVVQGGSTRRVKLDRNVGMDEVYIEGYLQAMLDTMFRQDYLKVKVTDEEVLLRNLPPNTQLMEEIMSAVKKFLIGEGLLAGESSLAAARPTRRLQGDNERRLGPAMIALCEQLLVVIAVQGLRRQAKNYLHLPRGEKEKKEEEKELVNEKAVVPKEEPPQERMLPRVKHAATNFVLSSAVAYLDGRLCRHIPNTLVRRIVSGFLLSFVE